jgi:uncharacterized membrane protein
MDHGNNIPGNVFTIDGRAPHLPAATDHFPDHVSNTLPLQLSMGAYNATQQSDIHAYWEFNQYTDWTPPTYELPFTGGAPGAFAAGKIGALQTIVPGSGPSGVTNTPQAQGDNPNNPRDPDRLLDTSPTDADRPMVNNPALYHLTYFPFLFLITVPFVWAFDHLGIFWDQRYLYLPAFVATLAILPLLVKRTDHRIALVALVGLNPQLFPFVIEGRNDFFVLFFLFAGIALLQRERRSWASLAIVAGTPLVGLTFSLPGDGRIGFVVLGVLAALAALATPR